MPLPKIKVCGMTQIGQVQQLAELGASYAGFIFYEKSPRYVVGKINPEDLKRIGQKIEKVGVFVNESYNTILKTVAAYGLDAVQLHGDETPDFCSSIAAAIKTIKAFRVSGDEDVVRLTKEYTAVDTFLFDTKTKEYGGSGKQFDWSMLLQQHTVLKPFFLSGGIGPGDVEAVLDFAANCTAAPFLVDVNSKFETSAGVKDIQQVKNFISSLQPANR